MPLYSLLPARRRLSAKIVGALLGFLLLALTAIGATLLLSWQLEGSAAAVNETGSLRMRSYRLTVLLSQVVLEPARPGAAAAAMNEVDVINATIARIRHGDPQRPLVLPPNREIRKSFDSTVRYWEGTMLPLATSLIGNSGSEQAAGWAQHLALVDGFVDQVDQLVNAIEHDSELRTFWLRISQLALVALALSGTVALIYLMFMLIIGPVGRLREGMRRMAEKDFGVRLPVESGDEIGQLTQGFNQMGDQLQVLYGTLEERVKEKTALLGDKNRELMLLYDSAAFLQLPQTLEATCEGILQRMQDYFQADGGSIRIIDHKNSNIHVVVHRGVSEALIEAERCLKVGDCLCGEAAVKKISVVHDLRLMDNMHKLQCHREGFATVSIFHIHAQQQHIGFFNLHFRKNRVFSDREKALLETLGQLLGVAIENLRLASREREMAISEERNLFAQGLHDSIAQGLTFLNLQVQMLDASLKSGRTAEAAAIVPALREGVQESYEDVRELLLNFRSRLTGNDLLGVLRNAVEKFEAQTGIVAELLAVGAGAPFPPEQQLQVLFIVQEALSNIRKHAHASRVEVRVEDGAQFMLSIRDNGQGFDHRKIAEKGNSHVGMHIMHERAQRIHAELAIDSRPGEGTVVNLKLLQADRRAA